MLERENLEKKRENRLKFMKAIYVLVSENKNSMVPAPELGAELGMDETTSERVAEYLIGEGLLRSWGIDQGTVVGITHRGIVEVEEAIMNPKKATYHFPPFINVINVEHMHNSQIQQGTNDSTQTKELRE